MNRQPSSHHPSQAGAAMATVLVIILVFLAVGLYIMLAVDRNTETRATYQRSVAGFHAAEAAVNFGAGDVRNALLAFSVPTNCAPQTLPGSVLPSYPGTVTYQLRVPGNAPGDCTPPNPVPQVTLPAGSAFQGLNAQVYTYDLRAEAQNAGATEAVVNMRFQAFLIPMFQFVAFYKEDLELTVGPPMVINGRMHTNRDLYLNTESCDPGVRILGQLTIVGDLYRGRKDSNRNDNKVRISLDGTLANLLTLGTTPGSESCARVSRRLVPQDEQSAWGGRIDSNLSQIAIPGRDTLLCARPWSCPPGTDVSRLHYWNNADLRIALDADPADGDGMRPLCPPGDPLPACAGRTGGPALWPVKVYNADGTVNAGLTDVLRTLMVEKPGVITYTDVPTAGWDCSTGPGSCEADYNNRTRYTPAFAPRGPRTLINGLPVGTPGSNYGNDYRYGGFYNWRERKPMLILNVDWMALEEWNRQQPPGQRLFDPNDTTHGGLVVYLSVKGPKSQGANNYGVRVYDAQRIRRDAGAPGVAFASDVAFYIAGNFNCADPDEGILDSASPMPCGPGGKRPTSVAADTINVLSCGWVSQAGEGEGAGVDPWNASGPCRNRVPTGADVRMDGPWGDAACDGSGESGARRCPYRPLDERSTQAAMPQAKRTVVNAAFLAGNDLTWCPGNPNGLDCGYEWYSGGLENYPRFHEDWTGASEPDWNWRYWYEGSLVAIDFPRHTCWGVVAGRGVADDPEFSCRPSVPTERRGFWRTQRYDPPQRRWFYDVAFNDARNLPPLAPRFVYLVQQFFTEEFR